MTIKELELASRTLSLEAAADSDTKGYRIAAIFNSITGKIDNFMTSIFDKIPGREITFSQDRSTAKLVSKSDYAELSKITVYTPPGLDVPYREYLSILETQKAFTDMLLDKQVRVVEDTMARMAKDVTDLRSKRTLSKMRAVSVDDIENAGNDIGNAFRKKSANTEVLLGDVVGNLRDWDSVTNRAQALSEDIMRRSRKEIIRSADNIFEYTKIISKKLNDDEEQAATLSKNVAELSSILHLTARAIEFTAVYEVQCGEFFTALADTQDKLKEEL